MPWRATPVDFDAVAHLAEELDCPEPMAWVLVRRGLAEPAVAREFLASDGPLDPPESIPGIAEAADRLAQAVRAGQRIVVHGDYDCDGISSTAILVRALEARGARVRPFLPSRFTDGYGVSTATVERLADEGCDLLVTVDCGTTAVEALTLAADLGIESIVCDHHLAGGQRPPAIIANPALGRGTDALPAAAGVTFKLTQALGARLDGQGLAPAGDEGIDLVALATIADAVPLIGENRRLVARGLAAIHAAPRPGIAALCAAASVSPRSLTARDLGWNIAPAINASGRMDHPMRALELLLADDGPQITERARALWELNMERRAVEQRVTAEAIEIVEASPPEIRDAHALVVAGEGWHEGVVGIVASRLVERFGRPAIVVSVTDSAAKGSGRSLPGVDLHGLVGAASGRLERWGGHAGAVGLQLAHDDIPQFRAELASAARAVSASIQRARIRTVDAVVGLRDLSLANAEALERLQPFGTGNPEVRLVVPAALVEAVGTVGKESQHLQVRLRAGGAHARAMGWRMGGRAADMPRDVRVDALVQLGVERWQDMVGPRVSVDLLDQLPAGVRAEIACATPCDAGCPMRAPVAEPGWRPAAAPPPAGPPRGVRDLRGHGVVLSRLAALAGADRGVVAVVTDVSRRRTLLEEVLEPARLGLDVAVLAGERCAPAERATRLAAVRERSSITLVEFDTLPHVELPVGTHVALLDPPADPEHVEWVMCRAAGRWLHLLYGEPEVAFARAVATRAWDVRTPASALWRAARDEGRLALADVASLTDEGGAVFAPARLARTLEALQEIGRAVVDPSAVTLVVDAPARPLEESPTHLACVARLAEQDDFLARALTLDLAGSAISCGDDVRVG